LSTRLEFRDIVIEIPEEVYVPSDDTYLLLENLQVESKDIVLEIGTGSGIISIIVAQTADKVIATDISPIAIGAARKNVELNHLARKIELREGNLFEPIGESEKFDLILFNAPYLPRDNRPRANKFNWLERSWDGGPTGRALIDPFIKHCSEFLKSSGKVQLVQSSLSNATKSCNLLEQEGFTVEIGALKAGFFEKIVLINATRMKKNKKKKKN